MKNIRTHYDNLQLPTTASEKEIRTAYRRLSKKYHPDYNSDPDAIRIMQLVNRAYEVLSDPEQKRQHDLWIAAQKNSSDMQAIPVAADAIPMGQAIPTAGMREKKFSQNKALLAILGSFFLIAIVSGVSIGLIFSKLSSLDSTDNTLYTVSATAPNGNAWPLTADNIQGYPQLRMDGTLNLSISNPHPKSAVLAQLFDRQDTGLGALRTFFLPANGGKFSINQLPQGNYFVRYMRLETGLWLQSEATYIQQNQDIILRGDDFIPDEFKDDTDEKKYSR
ncbi:MAG: J domain-containing protein [Neisseriaceae bacterium]|nr:J domain-containing protein [Neisseriaceae bacterium]